MLARAFALTTFFLAMATAMPLCAQTAPVPSTWGGDLGSRERLTGNWGGTRDEWAKAGFVLDEDVYWTPSAIVDGGKNQTGGNWGNAVTTMQLDTGKAGWWPGGHFTLRAVSSFGHNIYHDTGAIVPAVEDWSLPTLQSDTGLQEFTLLQMLSPKFGVIAGKFDLTATHNLFYGDFRNGFANTSINVPLAGALVPLSAFGAGALYLPNHDVHLTVMLLDPSGTIMSNDLGEAFDDGVMALFSGDVKTHLFGHPGHQTVLLAYSDKVRVSFVQDPSNLARQLLTEKYPLLGDPGPVLREIIAAKAPELLVPTEPLNTENKTWTAVYSVEQYLWQPAGDAKHGIGMFFTAGVSDGRANPIKNSFTLGLAGNGMVSGRPEDRIGIGFSRTEFSDYFMAGLRERFPLGLNHEDAFEAYYNFEVTPWLNVTPSLQAVRSGLEQYLDANQEFTDLGTTWLVGVRVGIRL